MNGFRKSNPARTIWLLLAPGFDVPLIAEFATKARQSSWAVTVVGLISGPITGAYGLTLLPDCTLDQLPATPAHILFLPGKLDCIQALLRDPRVHRLCAKVSEAGGQVFADGEVSRLVREAGIPLADLVGLTKAVPGFMAGICTPRPGDE